MAPLHKRLRSPMEKSFNNRCLFRLRLFEERSHDIMQDSDDLDLKTAFRECPSSLEVFKIRLSVAHRAMASELKYHQKFWKKIIMSCVP